MRKYFFGTLLLATLLAGYQQYAVNTAIILLEPVVITAEPATAPKETTQQPEAPARTIEQPTKPVIETTGARPVVQSSPALVNLAPDSMQILIQHWVTTFACGAMPHVEQFSDSELLDVGGVSIDAAGYYDYASNTIFYKDNIGQYAEGYDNNLAAHETLHYCAGDDIYLYDKAYTSLDGRVLYETNGFIFTYLDPVAWEWSFWGVLEEAAVDLIADYHTASDYYTSYTPISNHLKQLMDAQGITIEQVRIFHRNGDAIGFIAALQGVTVDALTVDDIEAVKASINAHWN